MIDIEIDPEIIAKAKQGDAKAFNHVSKKVLSRMRWIKDATGVNDAEDIEALKQLALWHALQKYDSSKAHKGKDNFCAFASQSIRWQVLDAFPHRRKKGYITLVPCPETNNEDGSVTSMMDFVESPYDGIDEEVLGVQRKLKKKIYAHGSNMEIRIYEYMCEHGLSSQAEISRALDTSETTVCFSMQRIKKFITSDNGRPYNA